MISLSVSSARTWRDCRVKYTLKHIERLSGRGPRPIPLERGSLIHELLEGHHRRGEWSLELAARRKWFDGLMTEEKETYGVSFVEDCDRVVTGWEKYWSEHGPMTTVSAEEAFVLPMDGGAWEIRGRIDWLARDADGVLWLLEHKTHSGRMPGEAERLGDLQTAVYLRAVEHLGYGTPAGVIHDYLRSTPPEVPRLLKSGKALSRAKDVVTDRATLLAAIEQHGFDPADYAEEFARADTTSFYERRKLARSRAVVDVAIDELRKQAADMSTGPVYRNLTRECGGCEYRQICEAQMFGLDVDYVKRSEYRTRSA